MCYFNALRGRGRPHDNRPRLARPALPLGPTNLMSNSPSVEITGDQNAPVLTPTEIDISDEEFAALSLLVYEQTGICLPKAKRPLLKSRLLKRLLYLEQHSFAQYYEYLKYYDPQKDELQEMINAITTNKTSFFRERHHFDYLREKILVPACRSAGLGRRPSLRFWSAGCSSGEEPYSIAITVATALERLPAWDIKILASDIDTEMLDKASAGIYPRDAVTELPPAVVKEHFLAGTGDYEDFVRVKPALRSLITFGRINLMDAQWPFHGKFDAIFCRNVIIYFDRNSQQQVLRHFAQYLVPEGIFFAGHSENLHWFGDLFEPIGQTVYRLRSS